MRFKIVKSWLRHFGILAFKRSSGLHLPEDEMPRLVQSLCSKSRPVVVDGGAHRGDFVHAIRSTLPDAQFICFEPDPDLSASLQRSFAGDAAVTVIAEALGNEAGSAKFNLNQSRATNSLLPSASQNSGALKKLVTTQSTVTVPITTIDAALAGIGRATVDIIKLDLQGYDYPALQGATNALATAAVVVVEVWFAPIYDGAADYLAVCNLMEARGFAMYALTGLHYGATDRLLWGDAVFVPRTSVAWLAPITH